MINHYLKEPTRFAVAGDWHGATEDALAATSYAASEGASTIVHLGDFGYRYETSFVQALSNLLTKRSMTLVFIDGNHDNHPLLRALPTNAEGVGMLTPTIGYLPRGLRWVWAQTQYLALGGAHSVDRPYRVNGRSWWPEETLSDTDVENAIKDGPVDVVFAHDAPLGSVPGLERTRYMFDSHEIQLSEKHQAVMLGIAGLVSPKTWYHGHYHTAHHTKTTLLDGSTMDVVGLDMGRDGPDYTKNIEIVDVR